MVTDLLLRSGRQLSKLRLEDRIAIRALRKNQGLKYKELAHKFNCSIPHIANIIGGRTGALDAEVLPRPKTAAVLNALPWVTMDRLTARR